MEHCRVEPEKRQLIDNTVNELLELCITHAHNKHNVQRYSRKYTTYLAVRDRALLPRLRERGQENIIRLPELHARSCPRYCFTRTALHCRKGYRRTSTVALSTTGAVSRARSPPNFAFAAHATVESSISHAHDDLNWCLFSTILP